MSKNLILMFFMCFFTGAALAASAPSASCGSGKTMYFHQNITLTNSSMPGSAVSGALVRTSNSCLNDDFGAANAICYMFPHYNYDYGDTTGTYQYVNVCPLS